MQRACRTEKIRARRKGDINSTNYSPAGKNLRNLIDPLCPGLRVVEKLCNVSGLKDWSDTLELGFGC